MNKNKIAFSLTLLLIAAGQAGAVEFEVIDQLLVNGAATVKSSATVSGKDAATGYSLMLSSGINMPAGTVNAGLFVGNGLGLTGVDFLGVNQNISGVKTFSSSITVTNALGLGLGLNRGLSAATPAQYGGVYSSTHVYVNGNVYAGQYFGDGSALSGVTGSDDLGDHIATMTVNMNSWDIVGVSTISFKSNVFISSASAVRGGGLYVSTNIYIVGFSSAAKYYGDGSSLTGITASDNLGNHIATTTVNMSTFGIVNVASITVINFIRTSTLTVIAPDTGPSSLWVSTSSANPHLYVSTNGNVGIGLSQPSARLQVQGYSAGNYTVYASTSATAGVYSVAVSSKGATNINNLVIENRAADPPAPDRGQIWLIAN